MEIVTISSSPRTEMIPSDVALMESVVVGCVLPCSEAPIGWVEGVVVVVVCTTVVAVGFT